MATLDKLKGYLYREVKSVAIDLQTGGVGWIASKGEEGEKIVSLRKKGENKHELVESPLTDLAISIPAFAFRTPVDQLQFGDIVILEDGVAFYIGKSNNDNTDNPVLRIISVKSGRTMDWNVARNGLLGGNAVMAVRNLANLFGGTGGGGTGGGFGGGDLNSLLPLLLLGDGKLGDNKMLLLMLMSQQNGGAGGTGGINPLLFLLMGDKKGGKDDLLPLLMMGGGLGGGAAGLLPFLLSGDDAKPDVKPVAKKAV